MKYLHHKKVCCFLCESKKVIYIVDEKKKNKTHIMNVVRCPQCDGKGYLDIVKTKDYE